MRRVALVLGLLCWTQTAHAEEDDDVRPVLAVAAGSFTAAASLGLGSYYIAEAHTKSGRNTSLLFAESGLCFSPLIAHAFVDEVARGAMFSLIPLAAEAATVTLMSFYPNFVTKSPSMIQWGTYTALSISIFGSALGILDAALISERRHKSTQSSLHLVPVLGRELNGAVLSGSL